MKKILRNTINIIFAIISIYLIISITIQKKSLMFKYDQLKLILCISIIIGILIFIYICISKKEIKHEKAITITAFAIIVILQLILGNLFKVTPSWDFGRIFREATDFSNTNNNIDYFCMCPNNIPILILFKSIFYIFNSIGLTNFLEIGIVINIIAIDLSILFTYLVAKKCIGINKAIMILIIFAIMPTTYLYAPIFYTDTLSMLFPILTIYLYLKIKELKNIKSLILLNILLGIVIFIGINLKFTIIIAWIAICIYEIFINKKDKQQCKQIVIGIGTAILVILALTCGKSFILKNYFIYYDKMENDKLPATHYIMMSLKGDGRYSQKDVDYSTSFNTYNERIEGNIAEIRNRAKKHTEEKDWLEFINNKIRSTWGDGTFYIPWQLERKPINNGIWQDFVFRDGKYSDIYKYYSQAIYISMLIFGLLSLFNTEKRLGIIGRLIIIGVFLTFVIWEAKSRYIVNFIPIFIIIEILGLDTMDKKIFNMKEGAKK